MVRLRILLMKYCSKPLRYSIYLLVLLTVSGCSNKAFSDISFNKLPVFNVVQYLSDVTLMQNSFLLAQTQSEPVSTVLEQADTSQAVSSDSKDSVKPDYAFALQLASVNTEQGLAYTLKKMAKRAPSIFQGKPILNVEVADVNEHTYYRLKFGGYKYLKNAKADCEAIKRQGIDCWVSNYTDNRIYF